MRALAPLSLLLAVAFGCDDLPDPADAAPPAPDVGSDAMPDADTEPDADPEPDAEPDVMPDAGPPDAFGSGQTCPECAEDEICVQNIDGTCSMGRPRCEPNPLNCRADACTEACNQHFCIERFHPIGTCDPLVACGGEARGALRCWGP